MAVAQSERAVRGSPASSSAAPGTRCSTSGPSGWRASAERAAAALRANSRPDPGAQGDGRRAGITELDAAEDVVPLLFQHSVYKSYPASLLERNRFTQLTKWLDRLTTHDLAGVAVGDCEASTRGSTCSTRNTDLRRLPLVGHRRADVVPPRARRRVGADVRGVPLRPVPVPDPEGVGGHHNGEYFNLVWPLYRYGRGAITRVPEMALGPAGLRGAAARPPPGPDELRRDVPRGPGAGGPARGELDQARDQPRAPPSARRVRARAARDPNRCRGSSNEIDRAAARQRIWMLGDLERALRDRGGRPRARAWRTCSRRTRS